LSARASYAEIFQISQKALEGLGLPHGLDMDAAANVAWLETRGLGGLAALAGDLEEIEPGTPWQPPEIDDNGETARFIATPARGLLLAPGVLDWVTLGVSVDIAECRSPLLIVAEAARRSRDGGGFRIVWSSEQGRSTAKCGAGEAALSLDLRSAREPSHVTVRAGKPPKDKDLRRLSGFHALSLRDGVLVDPDHWNAIKTAARRVQVPASERSRGGAGAEVDDSA